MMSSKFVWKGNFQGGQGSGAFQPVKEGKRKAVRTDQELCDEVFMLGDMLACHVFAEDGHVLGRNYGEIPVDDELKESFGQIAAVVWGGLRRFEGVGGPIRLVSAEYTNFKIVGIPFPNLKVGVLAVVPLEVDSSYLRERIREFVSYWSQVNELVGHFK